MKGEFACAVVLLGPSQVSTLWNSEVSAFQGSLYMLVYEDGIPDRANCPHYHRWLQFRGDCKVGTTVVWGTSPFARERKGEVISLYPRI